MIQRLNSQNLTFKASESATPREAYDSLMNKNSQTAQKQSKAVATLLNQVPMQGCAQKLDVIA